MDQCKMNEFTAVDTFFFREHSQKLVRESKSLCSHLHLYWYVAPSQFDDYSTV